ncbi:beta-lactamase [Chthoniobacter flavus Ellin428]|uniref:Beta-lactamase n=1 Tax=Chthoniobacter flavus Ellin428 TaxID=497964 RepID=B4D795_9BACT|nr:serine hydrolase [Chthoniobacter flavus]EDY17746.1 beta-lactamase [Chthoniobacter flavus Ellin428]TCO87071.1 CubicO group peptidase (beta-lactamase class C family) [Chthoniobacter flavus]
MKITVFLRASLLALFLLPRVFAETPVEWSEKHIRAQVKPDMPGVAVLVARDGQILFQGGFGLADVEQKVPITTETKFRIGSVTKQFVASAIMKLAEEGKLAISDPLAKYFPDLPNAKEITLKNLLTHTSGLKSYTERPDFFAGVTKPIEPTALIVSMQKDKPNFAPGTRYEYCNSGYFLLGEIVAKVSGQSLADYLRTTFFEPLGMKDTGIYVNANSPAGAAKGYAVAGGKATLALDWDMSWAGGAGAIYSTVGDLFHWTETLHAGRVVNAESLKVMTTPYPLPPEVDPSHYGFGLVISDFEGLPAIWHNGGLQGWSSNVVWLPGQKVVLVALANALPPQPSLEPAALNHQFAKHFLADEIAQLPKPLEDKAVDPKTFVAFVGRYDYLSAIMNVTLENDHLYAQLTGQEKYEIFSKAPDVFFWKITSAQVQFLRNDKGEVTAARHSQNGNTFRAPRLTDTKVTPEQLDAFVGKYYYGPAAVLNIRRDDRQLYAQLTGQPEMPIFPTADDSFEWHMVKASIHFLRGEDGKVTKLVHTQNGNTIDAPKLVPAK